MQREIEDLILEAGLRLLAEFASNCFPIPPQVTQLVVDMILTFKHLI